MKLWDGTKLLDLITNRRVCIVQYRILFSFHLAKLIIHPDPS